MHEPAQAVNWVLKAYGVLFLQFAGCESMHEPVPEAELCMSQGWKALNLLSRHAFISSHRGPSARRASLGFAREVCQFFWGPLLKA